MSSILEALRKVESRERRRPILLPPPAPRPRARLAAMVAAAAFVAGVAAVALVLALRPGAAPEPPAPGTIDVASGPPREPVEAIPAPSAPKVDAPPAPLAEAAPEEPVDEPVAAAEDEAAAESGVPEQITILRPAPEAVPEAEVQVEALPAPAPAAPPVDVLPGPPAGAPEIHVNLLIYSAVPERRQVSLTINSGPLVTLHEGQRSGEISLVRILRDRIHVEHNGRTYSVRAIL